MNKMIIRLALVLAPLFCATAQAKTYYVSDCQSGAQSGCVAGNDSNTGLSASTPWKTSGQVAKVAQNLAAGDQVLFAKGGSFTGSTLSVYNYNSKKDTPIVYDSYTPSWGGSAKPLLHFGLNFNAANPHQGYIVRNLELVGPGTQSAQGLFFLNTVQYVTLDHLTVRNFDQGFVCDNNLHVKVYITLTNSAFNGNLSTGVYAECPNVTIENNTFDKNGIGPSSYPPNQRHSIYFGGSGGATDIVIRGNTMTNTSTQNGPCEGTPMVVHGQIDGALIENNYIYETSSTGGCTGMGLGTGYAGVTETMNNMTVRGNTIVNVGDSAITTDSSPNILIENNVIVNTKATYQAAITVKARGSAEDGLSSNSTIRNNSIYYATAAQGSLGIRSSGDGGNHVVVNNLIYFDTGVNSDHSCFETGSKAPSDFKAFSNNLCFHAGSGGKWSSKYASLAAAKAAGFDANGLSTNPMLKAMPSANNTYSMAIATNSPAVNAGNSLLGALIDKLSTARTTADIGAYEAAATTNIPPSPPTSLVIQ